MLQKHQSRPLWARELKRVSLFRSLSSMDRSRPLWARELKPVCEEQPKDINASRPLWARELKRPSRARHRVCHCRAPCGRVN